MYDHDFMDDLRRQSEEKRKEERIKAQIKAQMEAMKPDLKVLQKFTDRELFMAIAERSCEFVKVVRPYEETVTYTRVNGVNKPGVTKTVNERIEFGAAMDLRTKYAEFDGDGKLIYFGQEIGHNY